MTLLERFGQFVMRSRWHAIIVILLVTFIPFLSWIGVAVIALVTLRRGVVEGLIIALWGSLPYMMLFGMHMWLPAINGMLFGNLFVWLLAALLRRTKSWALVLEIGVLFGVVGVIVAHGVIPDIQHFWHTEVTQTIDMIAKALQLPLKTARVEKMLGVMVQFATGIQAVIVLFAAFSELLIGRILESKLFAPKLWWKEWLKIKLDYVALLAILVCAGFVWFKFSIAKDVLPVLVFPFVVAGISLVHGVLVKYRASKFLVILFYGLLIVAASAFPLFLGALVLIAMLDIVFNFRARIPARVKL